MQVEGRFVRVLGNDRSKTVLYFGAIVAVLAALYASSFYSYILFHSLVEVTTIAIAFTLFTLTWNTRRFLTSGFLKALGLGYGVIAAIDLLHTLAYKGMGVFPQHGANFPTQLWIEARSLQAILLCVALFFIGRNLNEVIFLACAVLVALGNTILVYAGMFPDCFVEGVGLTTFKIVSEYVIVATFAFSLYLFVRRREAFNRNVFFLVVVSIVCMIGAELAFTSYISVYGSANLVGHFLKLIAFYLIYRALVVTGLREPFELIFRDLKQTQSDLTASREDLRKANEVLERRVAERTAELKTSEKKYRSLFESANDAVFIHEICGGMPGPFLEVNEVACHRLGYTREELTRLGPAEIDDPRYRDRIKPHLDRLLRDGHAVFETAQVAKDGRSMPVEVSSRIISLDSRQFIFSIVRDLTERQRAERARLAQIWFMESLDAINRVMQRTGDPQQLMNGVLDSVLSVFKCDRAFLLYASDSGAATFGVPIERYRPEYPGCSAAGVPVPVNEATTRILDAVRAAAGPVQFHANSEYKMPSDDTAAFGIQSVLAMRIQPRTGTECILGLHQCSYSRIWSDEEMRLFQEVGRRLENALTTLLAYQELRESREKLAEAQRIAHIGYWDLDLKNHRISLPEDSLRIFGFSVRQSVFDLEEWGAKWFKIVHPDDQEAVRRFIVKSVDSALAYNTEYRIIRADGQVRHIHSVANVIRDESGKPIRMMGMMQDVTDRKGVEEALRRLTEELEQRVKQRTAELQEQYEELERVNRLFVGRELKMVELKERIKELEQSKDH